MAPGAPGHTPGPWQVHGSRIIIAGPDRNVRTVAKTEPGGAFGMDAEQEANAALMAAAPDLLDALVDLLAEATHTGPLREERHGIEKARAAIAKARGAA
jgi:hypothetical protein